MTGHADIKVETPEENWARVFALDTLFDAMTTGRLCGNPVETGDAQLILVLLERLGWKPEAAELATALPHYPNTFGLAEIRSALANLGYSSAITPILGRRLRLCPPGTLVCDESGALWLIRTRQRGAELFQPGDLEQVRALRPMASYQTIQFEAHDLASNATADPTARSWSSNLAHRFLPELRLMFMLTMLSGLMAILIAFGIKTVFDTVIPSRNPSTLYALLVGLALIAAGELVLRRIRAGVASRLSGRLDYILGTSIFGKMLKLPVSMLTNASESDQLARLKQFETLRDVMGGPLLLLLLELGVALLLLITVAFIAWQLAAMLTCLALIILMAGFALQPGIKRASANLSRAQSRFNAGSQEALTCRRSIRRRGLYEHFAQRQRDHMRTLLRAQRKLASEMRLLDGLALISLPTAGASAIGVGALLVMQGSLSSGQLIAATILTWRLFAPIQQTIQILPKLPESRRLLNQIDLFFQLREDASSRHTDVTRECQGNIAVKDLVVRFPGAILPTLVGGRFDIPKGKLVAVSGPSGSGKSTLMRVLSGTLTPQSGIVTVDAFNLSQLSRSYRDRHIGYVPAAPVFIYGTVAQNLRLGTPGATDAQIEGALAETGLSDWVHALPQGIDTRIDPVTMSDALPPGTKALLSVAQALLTNPAILLLDEPAGGLDAEQEAALMRMLHARRGTMTTLLVTHRPSLIRQADGLLYLEGGTVQLKAPQPTERATA
ncbi:MAG: ABC transporter transmembrane domain-containing protein [Pseudomonadota bacterium]